MLDALGDPLSFLVLLVAFVVCVTLSGWLTSVACARQGLPGVRQEGRTRLDPRRQLDPFGAVAALVAGFGWARPVDAPSHRRGAGFALAVLAGPLVVLALGLGALAAFGAVEAPVDGASAAVLQHGLAFPIGQRAWLLAGLMATYVGALGLVPLPPLPGGQALFAVAPRSRGWQQAQYQLADRNIGTAVLLALLLLPLGGGVALLPAVLDSILGPLVRLVSGG